MSGDQLHQIAGFEHVEDANGHFLFTAEHDRVGVHDAQFALDDFVIGQGFVARGFLYQFRIGRVDAVDLGGLEYDISADRSGVCSGCTTCPVRRSEAPTSITNWKK